MLEELEYYISLGDRISVLRDKKGLTQEKLGKLLDLSRVSIVNIEKGRQKPSVYLLYKIAFIFEISLTDILGDKIDERLRGFKLKSGESGITNQDYDDLSDFMSDDTFY